MKGYGGNIRVALQYIEAWLGGLGAVAIYGLMEDAATAEISRASIWQWIKHGATLSNGEKMTVELFRRVASEEVEVVKSEVGDDRWQSGHFKEALNLLDTLCVSDKFDTFLTLDAYENL